MRARRNPNIFYTGATPQQQALPAVDYLIRQGQQALLPARHRHRLSAHHQRRSLKSYLHAHGIEGDAIAEFYTPFNHKGWEGIVEWIRRFGAVAATRPSSPR